MMSPPRAARAARPRRGLLRLGCRRQALPRLPRRHRRQLARPRASGVRGCREQAGRDPRARLELLRDPAAARARRAAHAPHRSGRGRPRVLRQLRRRGDRGRVQARPAEHGGRSQRRILALQNSFHGRTMGSLALTGKPRCGSRSSRCCRASSTSTATIEALEAAIDDTVAALFVEPIKGEAGVVDLPEGYLAARARAHRSSTARC